MACSWQQIMLAVTLLLAARPTRAAETRLLCINGPDLEIRTPDSSAVERVDPRPPAEFENVIAAGNTIVGVDGGGQVFQLRDGRWRSITSLQTYSPGRRAVLVGTKGDDAYLWLEGAESDTTAGSLWISPSGKVTFRKGGAVEWPRFAPARLGELSLQKYPPSLAKLLHLKPDSDTSLTFAEPSPWGGVLVAAPTGAQEGDGPPDEVLYYVPPKGKPVPLKVGDIPITHYALVGYGPGEMLLARGPEGAVLIGPDAKIHLVGVGGPCVWWHAKADALPAKRL